MKKLSLLLADDEALIRQGMKVMLQKEGISKIYEATNGEEALAMLHQQPMDLVLLDIRMRGKSGIETLKGIKKSFPKTHVIVVTSMEGTELILNLLKDDLDGFVLKGNKFEEIIKAIKVVKDGGKYFPEMVMKVIRNHTSQWDAPPPVHFKDQELKLTKAIVEGLTTKEIAKKYHMSLRTAETNRQRLLEKTRSLNTAGLIAYAYRNGII